MFSKVRHLLYANVKDLTENRASVYTSVRYKVELSIFVYFVFRTWLWTYLIANQYTYNVWQYDYFLYFTHEHPRLYNQLFTFQFSMLAIFVFVLQRGLYRNAARHPRTVALKKFYLLVVRNTELFKNSMRSPAEMDTIKQQYRVTFVRQLNQCKWTKWTIKWIHLDLVNWIVNLKVDYVVFKRVDSVDMNRVRLGTWKSPSYFHLPTTLRCKLYKSIIVMEYFGCAVQLVIVILEIYFGAMHLPYMAKSFPYWYIPWILLDYICISYEFLTIIQAGFTFSFFSVLSAMVHNHKLAYAYGRLCEHLGKYRWIANSKRLDYFLVEHHKVCLDIMRGNQELWSEVLLAFLVTNIPANIYLATRISLDSGLEGFEKYVIWTVLFCQSTSAVLVLFPLASFCGQIHKRAKCLPTLQYHIPSSKLWYKLKFDDLFKRLTSGPKYGVTIGPLHAMTNRVITELILTYVAYLLNAFQMKL